eukprot:TRINITY_DN1760_c0_g1_i1.p1 TRINITY_DN1760_c0_g1~~TRINITY_DN1760_c0_g1_i1.p1  ORF type:complete len:411 (+),score=80.19 TRINITY_DN1760_c0_g1_i1:52-1233(+)
MFATRRVTSLLPSIGNTFQLFQTRSYAKKPTSKTSKSIQIDFKVPYQLHKCDGPATSTTTNSEEALGFYREMNYIRRMEIAADGLYKQKKIRGFLHLYNGQEAVASGLEYALTPEDHVITAYRDHAFMVTRRAGGTAKEVLSELMGKKTGCSKGKGGSMHMYNAKTHFYGGNGIVGAQCPVGTGLAFAQKYLKNGGVTVTYYGDGAANQGQLFESYNMAALWKLPVIYVCENNQYAMGTSTKRASFSQEYFKRGDFIPGVLVDGMNVLTVKEAGKYAVNFVKENGPIILEMKTYRYFGHSMSDPGTTYRTRDEINKIREESDPINQIKNIILEHQLATEEELKEIDKEIRQEIDEAIAYAEKSPEPSTEDLFMDVYVEKTRVRGTELANSFSP